MSERKLDKDLEEEIGFMISSHLGDIYDELRITQVDPIIRTAVRLK